MVNKYIDFVKKNITSYMKAMMGKRYDKDAFLIMLDTYIEVRYYNYYDVKYKNFEANINYYMKNKVLELIKDKDDKYIEKVKEMFYLFKYILYFDDVKEVNSVKDIVLEIEEYRRIELGISEDNFVNSFIDMINSNNKRKIKFLNSFDSDEFYLKYIDTNKNGVFYAFLDNSVKFNKIYSDYAINKVYNNGIINEDKLFICYYMISNVILKNAIKGEFTVKYLVDFPNSIFDKKEKINRLFNIINSEIVKNNIVLKFVYSEYLNNKDYINTLIKNGYMIAMELDDKFIYNDANVMRTAIFSYVIVDDINSSLDKDKIIIIGK